MCYTVYIGKHHSSVAILSVALVTIRQQTRDISLYTLYIKTSSREWCASQLFIPHSFDWDGKPGVISGLKHGYHDVTGSFGSSVDAPGWYKSFRLPGSPAYMPK